MRDLITEGEEALVDDTHRSNDEEKYVFLGSAEEHKNLIEVTVELRNDSSTRAIIMVNPKYRASFLTRA